MSVITLISGEICDKIHYHTLYFYKTSNDEEEQDPTFQEIQICSECFNVTIKEEFLLTDGATELDFFHVQYPQGSGGAKMKHLHLNKDNFKKKKRAIVVSLAVFNLYFHKTSNDNSRRCTHIL
jgi:hypothetical protein